MQPAGRADIYRVIVCKIDYAIGKIIIFIMTIKRRIKMFAFLLALAGIALMYAVLWFLIDFLDKL